MQKLCVIKLNSSLRHHVGKTSLGKLSKLWENWGGRQRLLLPGCCNHRNRCFYVWRWPVSSRAFDLSLVPTTIIFLHLPFPSSTFSPILFFKKQKHNHVPLACMPSSEIIRLRTLLAVASHVYGSDVLPIATATKVKISVDMMYLSQSPQSEVISLLSFWHFLLSF